MNWFKTCRRFKTLYAVEKQKTQWHKYKHSARKERQEEIFETAKYFPLAIFLCLVYGNRNNRKTMSISLYFTGLTYKPCLKLAIV